LTNPIFTIVCDNGHLYKINDYLADGLIAAVGWCEQKDSEGKECGGRLIFREKKPLDKK